MKIQEIFDNIYCVDTLFNNEERLIASYILDFEHAAIIETGPKSVAENVANAVREIGIRDVKFIFITHVHLDHGGGATALAKKFPDARIICHPKAAKHVVNPEKLWKVSIELSPLAETYGKPDPIEDHRVLPVSDNERIDLEGITLRAIHTPGHASHHVSYFIEDLGILFPGDSAGMCAEGSLILATPPSFHKQLFLESLEKMKKLNPAYIGYTHFGLFNANGLLEKVEKIVTVWSEIAKKSRNLEEFKRILFETDEDLKNFHHLYKNSEIMKSWIDLGIRGFFESVKKR